MRRRALALLCVAAVLAGAACGDDDPGDGNDPATTETTRSGDQEGPASEGDGDRPPTTAGDEPPGSTSSLPDRPPGPSTTLAADALHAG